MRRLLFSLVALLSLLLCAATLAWWARSYLPADLHVGAAEGRLILVFSDPPLTTYWLKEGPSAGRAQVSAAGLWSEAHRGAFLRQRLYARNPTAPGGYAVANLPPRTWSFAGVVSITEPVPAGQATYRLLAVPLPYIAAVLAVAPTAWVVTSLRRRRRSRAGHCQQCGYDLRATPGRCPECGATAAVDAEGPPGQAHPARSPVAVPVPFKG